MFSNKAEENKVEVRPSSLLPFQMGKVLLSQLLKIADKNHHTFLWTTRHRLRVNRLMNFECLNCEFLIICFGHST